GPRPCSPASPDISSHPPFGPMVGGVRPRLLRPRATRTCMAPLLLYATCAVGAIGLYMILRPGAHSAKIVGVLVGLAAIVFLGIQVVRDGMGGWGGDESPLFFGLFVLIAVAGAVRVVTQPRPVYAALYFVLVVLASAGLFLLLQAEFMAFAL